MKISSRSKKVMVFPKKKKRWAQFQTARSKMHKTRYKKNKTKHHFHYSDFFQIHFSAAKLESTSFWVKISDTSNHTLQTHTNGRSGEIRTYGNLKLLSWHATTVIDKSCFKLPISQHGLQVLDAAASSYSLRITRNCSPICSIEIDCTAHPCKRKW